MTVHPPLKGNSEINPNQLPQYERCYRQPFEQQTEEATKQPEHNLYQHGKAGMGFSPSTCSERSPNAASINAARPRHSRLIREAFYGTLRREQLSLALSDTQGGCAVHSPEPLWSRADAANKYVRLRPRRTRRSNGLAVAAL